VRATGSDVEPLPVVVRSPSAAELADRVVALHAGLEALSHAGDLEPGDLTDALFTALVEACAHRPHGEVEAVLADPRVRALVPRLRELCADGEFRLERSWAHRVAVSAHPDRELEAFPYLDNYRALTALELGLLAGLAPTAAPERVCVLGSGPLPLTALLTARALGIPVDAVDLDGDASLLAREVLRRLPGGHLVHVHRADARHFPGMADADVVVLAALVGLDRGDKRGVIAAVTARMRPGALLAVRSAHRLRTLLYPAVTPDEIVAAGGGRLTALAEVRPFHDVVNSLVVAVRT